MRYIFPTRERKRKRDTSPHSGHKPFSKSRSNDYTFDSIPRSCMYRFHRYAATIDFPLNQTQPRELHALCLRNGNTACISPSISPDKGTEYVENRIWNRDIFASVFRQISNISLFIQFSIFILCNFLHSILYII